MLAHCIIQIIYSYVPIREILPFRMFILQTRPVMLISIYICSPKPVLLYNLMWVFGIFQFFSVMYILVAVTSHCMKFRPRQIVSPRESFRATLDHAMERPGTIMEFAI